MDHYRIAQLERYAPQSMAVSPLALYSASQHIDIELRQPLAMVGHHWHSQIEINIPFASDVEYCISGERITVQANHVAIFWASVPHQLVDVKQCRIMAIITIPLHQFLSWSLPAELVHQLTHGMVLQSLEANLVSFLEVKRWLVEHRDDNPLKQQLTFDEIAIMLRRMSIDGWNCLLNANTGKVRQAGLSKNTQKHVCQMLQYIAEHSQSAITVSDVAKHVGLNPNYAMGIFQSTMHLTIKQYVSALRINHARALLADTQQSVLSIALATGLNSVSHFYDLFQRYVGMTPHQYRKHTRQQTTSTTPRHQPMLDAERGACDGRRSIGYVMS